MSQRILEILYSCGVGGMCHIADGRIMENRAMVSYWNLVKATRMRMHITPADMYKAFGVFVLVLKPRP